MISKEEKREFLITLLETCAFKSRTSVHILSALVKKSNLDKIHLVTDVSNLHLSITLPLLESDGAASYVYNHRNITPENFLMHWNMTEFDGSDIYLKIDMLKTNELYTTMLSLLETNNKLLNKITKEIDDEIDVLFSKAYLDAERVRITKEIDAALDAKDEVKFVELSKLYMAITEEIEAIDTNVSGVGLARSSRLIPPSR